MNQLKEKAHAIKNCKRKTRRINYKEKGITLVALVVTIIVLLILAGIAISLVLGENGILGRAQTSYRIQTEAQIQEEIELAWDAVQVDGLSKGWSNETKSSALQTELRKQDDSAITEYIEPNIEVTYKGYETTINANTGSITSLAKNDENSGNITGGIDWEELKQTATKHPDQSALNDDIGIDANGNICNLDLWYYEVLDELYLGEHEGSNIDTSCYIPCREQMEDTSNFEMHNLVCPQCIKINGVWRDVTILGSGSFYGYSEVESVILPSSINKISFCAFFNCTSLISVTMPNSVTEIEDAAFRWCSSLTNITIPNSVTEIGFAAFDGCSSLSSITIPSLVTEIGDSAFYDCTSLTSVKIDSATIVNNMYNGNASFSRVCGNHVIENIYINSSLYNSNNDTIVPYEEYGYNYLFETIENGYAKYVYTET